MQCYIYTCYHDIVNISWRALTEFVDVIVDPHTQAGALEKEIKKPQPDAASQELIDFKHTLNTSLDAAVAEWRANGPQGTSWLPKAMLEMQAIRSFQIINHGRYSWNIFIYMLKYVDSVTTWNS